MSDALDLVVSRLAGARRAGEGWQARCPVHKGGQEQNPSLSIGRGDVRAVMLKCFAGCDPADIVRALGLDPHDILGARSGADVRDSGAASAGRAHSAEGITVADLARAKGLPEDFLRQLGVHDAAGRERKVLIPYRDAEGRTVLTRTRSALRAKQGTKQPAGTPLMPYGVDRLAGARAAGTLLVVEGESDCWAAWRHDVPALGLPGASSPATALAADHLDGIERLDIVREPDDGGTKFIQKLSERLAALGWQGQALVLSLPVKDVADLHLTVGGDHAAFLAALGRARADAVPLADAVAAVADTAGGHAVIAIHDEPWPEPARVLGLPAAPALDLDLFPLEVARVVRDATERLQCPPDFLAWPLVVSLAGLVGRGACIRPRQRDAWAERACLWVATIGDPSTLKSPALREGAHPLRYVQAQDTEAYRDERAAWEAECDAIRAQAGKKRGDQVKLPPEPVLRRRWTADATVEKLADLMGEDKGGERGLTLVRDELAGWIGQFNKYSGRSDGDRTFYLECYSGGAYPVDRVIRGTILVPDLYLNVVGGMQPDRARRVFGEGDNDGFAARFIAAYPEPSREYVEVDRSPDVTARRDLNDASDRLAGAAWASLLDTDPLDEGAVPFCRLDPEAGRWWSEWHTDLNRRLREGAWEGRLAARIGKYAGLAARLALVWHLVAWAAGRVPDAAVRRVPADTMAAVLDLMDRYVMPMDRRVYAAFDRAEAANGGERIARWLVTDEITSFTLRDVRRHEWSGLTTPEAVAAAVEWLAAKGWVREADPEQRTGRPANRFDVNPRVWEAADDHAA